jgi:hypothetical protein
VEEDEHFKTYSQYEPTKIKHTSDEFLDSVLGAGPAIFTDVTKDVRKVLDSLSDLDDHEDLTVNDDGKNDLQDKEESEREKVEEETPRPKRKLREQPVDFDVKKKRGSGAEGRKGSGAKGRKSRA